jgi:site-specific DNA-methyltransferase (adenine-specific)
MKLTDKIEIINQDCIDFLKNISDKSIDYSFTSPPYNRKRNDKYKNFVDINNDYLKLNIDVITELLRVTKKHIFYNIQANYYNRKDVYKLIGYFSENIVDIHIWEKSNPMPAGGNNITNAIEYFIILGDESLKSNTTYTKNILTTGVNSEMPKDHKAVMKLDVAEYFISNFTQQNDIILDCFFGYGTTAIACHNYNRKVIGCEIDTEYYNKAIERIQNHLLQQKLF